jgi:hypothetical protein
LHLLNILLFVLIHLDAAGALPGAEMSQKELKRTKEVSFVPAAVEFLIGKDAELGHICFTHFETQGTIASLGGNLFS